MSRFIQPLEQRVFLSVTSSTLATDLSTVHTDATAVRTTASTNHQTLLADLKTLMSDVRSLKVTSNNKLIATFNHDNAIGQAKINGAQAGFLATDESLSAVVTAEGKLLLLKPSNTRLRTKLSSDTANLNSKVASKASTLQTDVTNWQSAVDTDLTGITTANSSSTTVGGDVSKTKADIALGISNYNNAVSAFKAAVNALTADLNSIP
jgi:hypothetical protein